MAYSLATHYAGQGLLDGFAFFTGKDPSHGFVDYQSKEDAMAQGLVSIDEFNRVRLGVDSVHTYTTSDTGRPSVRITSKDDFTHGLFIADFAHMPGSTCGTWPAFWAFNDQDGGALWPMGGEVDIIEGANTAQRNLISAHTEPGCHAPDVGFTGVQGPVDCSLSPTNIGCNFAAPTADSATFGDAFNAEGGGVYALQWDSENLKIWHFPRSAIPDDITNAPVVTPDPSTWGPPQALFGGSSCDPDTYFFNLSLVINTDFCGDYAGNIWGVADECNKLAPTCEDYVARNPSSFNNAFWEINYIDIYQQGPQPGNHTGLPSNTTMSIPSRTPTGTPMPGNNTMTPSHTRTVTVSTATQMISTAKPTQTNTGTPNPATIDGYTLLGCFGSVGGYQSFSEVASFKTMDNEACVASCAGRKYAGVSGEGCYCADTLGDATATANRKCNTPCPGNPSEFCGGVLSASNSTGPAHRNMTALNSYNPPQNTRITLRRRASPASNLLLTVYGDIDEATLPPGAPGMGGGNGTGSATQTTTSGTTGSPSPTGTATVTAITVTYTTICPTDAAHLTTVEYCSTLGYPAAMQDVSVPMTTCTETCDACGPHGESTVTLTVPAAVHTSTTATATVTGSGSGSVVVAIAVETVVPIPHLTNTTAPALVPVMTGGGVRAKRTSGNGSWISLLGYGVLGWFGAFAALLVF
ncbi:glycoside hydrolase family 16 protein [Xylariaceae sp. FL0255]|nr:glycoside hydrolase family 16 protein [Xylariaceae sp. FL0255]